MDNKKKNNTTDANTHNKANRTEFADDMTNCNDTTNNTNQKSNKNNK